MKKYLYRTLGYTIIISCSLSAALCTISEIAILMNLLFVRDFVKQDSMLFFSGIVVLPILCFFWWGWSQKSTINKIQILLKYGNKNS